MDIYCAKCGEPWDAWGVNHGDMKRAEASRFKRGEGCPACEFGTVCAQCGGTGTDATDCRTCFGYGRVVGYKLVSPLYPGDPLGHWFMRMGGGRTWPLSGEPYKRLPNETSLEGEVACGWFWCPDCGNQGPPCPVCGGDGKFHPDGAAELNDNALAALLEASDEDPLTLIEEWHWTG